MGLPYEILGTMGMQRAKCENQLNNQLGALASGTIWQGNQLSNRTITLPIDSAVINGNYYPYLSLRVEDKPKTIRQKLQAETDEWLKDVFT
jgi:hypothetical protein